MTPLANIRSKYAYARLLLEEAGLLYTRRAWQEAAGKYETALQACPELMLYICAQLSALYGNQQNWSEVMAIGRRAIAYNEGREIRLPVGEFQYNIGALLLQQNAREEGLEHMRQAVLEFATMAEIDPHSSAIQLKWGDALAYTGDMPQAALRFARAVELDPLEAENRLNLVYVLMNLHREEDAREELERGIRILTEGSNEEGAAELRDYLDNFEVMRLEAF